MAGRQGDESRRWADEVDRVVGSLGRWNSDPLVTIELGFDS